MPHDVVIIGGGPAGLSAALVLARGCKQVVLCDAGPPRNAAAERMHGFVTRDGTPPTEFRRIAREQLAAYASVELRGDRVVAIEGEIGQFRVVLDEGSVLEAKRVLLCVGMIDELPKLPGVRELWGKSIFQCPYCHGWEHRQQPFGVVARSLDMLEWAPFLLGWTSDLLVFTEGRFAVPDESRERLGRVGIRLDERRIRSLVHSGGGLEAVEMDDGELVARGVLFMHPPQRQTELVTRLGLELDERGFVRIDERKQTSRAGIHAAGDATTMLQGAMIAASEGARAAYSINHELTVASGVG